MEFGRVPENELNNIDFSLPLEPAFNKKILSEGLLSEKSKPAKDPKVYVGCAKWGRTEWVGKIYPHKTKEKDFLQHYVEHYNSIELNATHYKVVGPAGIRKSAEQAGARDFKFCPKMLYFFMHMHDEATSPELTVYRVDKMNAVCGLNLIKPKFFNSASPENPSKRKLSG